MSILLILLIICPGIVATELYQFFKKEELSLEKYIVHIALFIFLIAWVNFIVLWLMGWKMFTFQELSIQFMVKYISLSTLVSLVEAFIMAKLKK